MPGSFIVHCNILVSHPRTTELNDTEVNDSTKPHSLSHVMGNNGIKTHAWKFTAPFIFYLYFRSDNLFKSRAICHPHPPTCISFRCWRFSAKWWRHDIETLSALHARCEENRILCKGAVIRRFDVFSVISLDKLLNTYSSCPDLRPCAGLILGLRPANMRRRYKVTPSLIGWAQT